MSNYKEKRPWGTFETLLASSECKVKKIIVSPNQRPRYQYHHKRTEVWVVVRGVGIVTIDDVESEVREQSVVVVPVGSRHRIKNIGEEDLIFIEVQLGTYFGEDDIVRLEDDYER